MHFHYGHAQHKNPCLGGHKICDFGRLSLGHHYDTLSLCKLIMPQSKEDFQRNNAFSLNDFYDHAPAQEPLPWGHEIYNFGRLFLGHHYHLLSLSVPCSEVEKNFFKEKHQLFSFYPQITCTCSWDGGNIRFTIFFNQGEDVNGRRTTTDANPY